MDRPAISPKLSSRRDGLRKTVSSDARQVWGFAVSEHPVQISHLLALVPDGVALDFVWKAPGKPEAPLN